LVLLGVSPATLAELGRLLTFLSLLAANTLLALTFLVGSPLGIQLLLPVPDDSSNLVHEGNLPVDLTSEGLGEVTDLHSNTLGLGTGLGDELMNTLEEILLLLGTGCEGSSDSAIRLQAGRTLLFGSYVRDRQDSEQRE